MGTTTTHMEVLNLPHAGIWEQPLPEKYSILLTIKQGFSPCCPETPLKGLWIEFRKFSELEWEENHILFSSTSKLTFGIWTKEVCSNMIFCFEHRTQNIAVSVVPMTVTNTNHKNFHVSHYSCFRSQNIFYVHDHCKIRIIRLTALLGLNMQCITKEHITL